VASTSPLFISNLLFVITPGVAGENPALPVHYALCGLIAQDAFLTKTYFFSFYSHGLEYTGVWHGRAVVSLVPWESPALVPRWDFYFARFIQEWIKMWIWGGRKSRRKYEEEDVKLLREIPLSFVLWEREEEGRQRPLRNDTHLIFYRLSRGTLLRSFQLPTFLPVSASCFRLVMSRRRRGRRCREWYYSHREVTPSPRPQF